MCLAGYGVAGIFKAFSYIQRMNAAQLCKDTYGKSGRAAEWQYKTFSRYNLVLHGLKILGLSPAPYWAEANVAECRANTPPLWAILEVKMMMLI
jgi:hypothetical protein